MTQEIKNAVNIIVEHSRPEKIILFGSRAKDTGSGKSDYDFCILKSGITKKRQLAQKLYKLLYTTKLPIDIIVETPEKFSELKNFPSLIYYDIFNHGKVIYEKK